MEHEELKNIEAKSPFTDNRRTILQWQQDDAKGFAYFEEVKDAWKIQVCKVLSDNRFQVTHDFQIDDEENPYEELMEKLEIEPPSARLP